MGTILQEKTQKHFVRPSIFNRYEVTIIFPSSSSSTPATGGTRPLRAAWSLTLTTRPSPPQRWETQRTPFSLWRWVCEEVWMNEGSPSRWNWRANMFTCVGDGSGEGCDGYWSVHEAAKESQRAGAGEEETAGQCGQDGGAQQAQGDSLYSTEQNILEWGVSSLYYLCRNMAKIMKIHVTLSGSHVFSSLKGSESRSPTSERETADLAYDNLKVHFSLPHTETSSS